MKYTRVNKASICLLIFRAFYASLQILKLVIRLKRQRGTDFNGWERMTLSSKLSPLFKHNSVWSIAVWVVNTFGEVWRLTTSDCMAGPLIRQMFPHSPKGEVPLTPELWGSNAGICSNATDCCLLVMSWCAPSSRQPMTAVTQARSHV